MARGEEGRVITKRRHVHVLVVQCVRRAIQWIRGRLGLLCEVQLSGLPHGRLNCIPGRNLSLISYKPGPVFFFQMFGQWLSSSSVEMQIELLRLSLRNLKAAGFFHLCSKRTASFLDCKSQSDSD